MRPLKLYVHPEFKAEPEDLTLWSTICFVLVFVIVGAFFILGVSCLVFWDDCNTSYYIYRSKPHILTLRELLHG
ncbi:hypothetical protein BD414DRAFT_533668 [Trametes punicea]|nr:hypothetical protein BD414DRAFT_533668 [Trametes punicea]